MISNRIYKISYACENPYLGEGSKAFCFVFKKNLYFGSCAQEKVSRISVTGQRLLNLLNHFPRAKRFSQQLGMTKIYSGRTYIQHDPIFYIAQEVEEISPVVFLTHQNEIVRQVIKGMLENNLEEKLEFNFPGI